MRPDTVELFTCLACAEAKKNIDTFVHLDAATLDADTLRDYAVTCADIIVIFEALENLLMTAAEELDVADQGAEFDIHHPTCTPDMLTENVLYMTHEEHAEAHAPLK